MLLLHLAGGIAVVDSAIAGVCVAGHLLRAPVVRLLDGPGLGPSGACIIIIISAITLLLSMRAFVILRKCSLSLTS